MTSETPPSEDGAPYRRRSGVESSDKAIIRVIAPEEPPRLTPGSAEALLRILIKERARLTEEWREQHERESE